jgi:glycosyltransferase involved in cell wall biosynthesis
VSFGFPSEKISTFPGAINRTEFYPISRNTNSAEKYVLLAGSFKKRKNPEKVISLIKSMPQIKFKMHALFDSYSKKLFSELEVRNLEIIKFKLQKQPDLMRNANLYLSLSNLEGGPITILEALASGTPYLSTNTGIAPDLAYLNSGKTLPMDCSIEEVRNAILDNWNLKETIGYVDLLNGNFSWEQFGTILFLN